MNQNLLNFLPSRNFSKSDTPFRAPLANGKRADVWRQGSVVPTSLAEVVSRKALGEYFESNCLTLEKCR